MTGVARYKSSIKLNGDIGNSRDTEKSINNLMMQRKPKLLVPIDNLVKDVYENMQSRNRYSTNMI